MAGLRRRFCGGAGQQRQGLAEPARRVSPPVHPRRRGSLDQADDERHARHGLRHHRRREGGRRDRIYPRHRRATPHRNDRVLAGRGLLGARDHDRGAARRDRPDVSEFRFRANRGLRVRMEPGLGACPREGGLHPRGPAPEADHEGGTDRRLLPLRAAARMSGSIGDTRFSTGGARLQVLAAALTFSIGGAGIKACRLTSWQVTSFRSGIAALTLLLLLPEARKGWNARAALVGVAYAATVTLFVLANKLTTSANTIFLQSTAPLYILLLSPWLLREPIRARDVLVMAVVVLGMSLLFVGTEHRYATAPDPVHGNILATLSGLTWAFTLMGLRWMGRHETPASEPALAADDPVDAPLPAPAAPGSAAPAVVIGNLIAFFVGLPFALPVIGARPLDWAIVGGLGTIQIGVAYVFLTSGMRHVRALEASMLLLLEPVLNPIWSWLIHGETPRAWSLLGGAIILGGTLGKTWLDSRMGRTKEART